MDSREPSGTNQEVIVPDKDMLSRKENAPKKAAGSKRRGGPFTSRDGRLYMCSECSYLTQYSRKLTVHLRTHSDQPSFRCPECHNSFCSKSSLNRHVQHGHCRGRPTAGSRKSSRRRKGPCVPVRRCELCVYATTNLYNLKLHMRTHADVRPYACEPCGVRFRTQSHLYRHMGSQRHQTASS